MKQSVRSSRDDLGHAAASRCATKEKPGGLVSPPIPQGTGGRRHQYQYRFHLLQSRHSKVASSSIGRPPPHRGCHRFRARLFSANRRIKPQTHLGGRNRRRFRNFWTAWIWFWAVGDRRSTMRLSLVLGPLLAAFMGVLAVHLAADRSG
jgi:hypothetical protein